MKCEHCGKEIDEATRISAYWMWDNHTFTRLQGIIDQIVTKAIECEEQDHWGMVCPVIVLSGEKELRRVGPFTNGRGSKGKESFLQRIDEWKSEILKDEDIARLIQNEKSGAETDLCESLRDFNGK